MEAEIRKTQESLGRLISSPVFTEKVLQKPPLRFLHDIFIAITKEHGLMRGLFDDDEVAWKENVANDKDAKLFFIAKVINYVSIATGSDIQIRSSKVCSGHDADKTNKLLQELARLIQEKVDGSTALQRVKNGEGPEKLEAFAKGLQFLMLGKDEGGEVKSRPTPTEGLLKRSTNLPSSVDKQSRATPDGTAQLAGALKPTSTTKKPGPIIAKDALLVKTNVSSRSTQQHEKTRPTVVVPSSQVEGAVNMPDSHARPTTARRAPQRPLTAKVTTPQTTEMTRRNTFVKDKASTDEQDVVVAPVGVNFLAEVGESQHDDMVNGLDEGPSPDEIYQLEDYGVSTGQQPNDLSGHLVSHLRDAQKAFVDGSGYTEDENATNVLGQQETVRFKKDIEDLQRVLQRVSRLTDIISTHMQILPEDFEEMDKDRQRYLEEIQLLHQQIDQATKAEEGEMDKLRREQSLQEELLFVIDEEIASAQYRIKEKSGMHDKLKRLSTKH